MRALRLRKRRMQPDSIALLQIGNLRDRQFFTASRNAYFNLRTGQVERGCGRTYEGRERQQTE